MQLNDFQHLQISQKLKKKIVVLIIMENICLILKI